MSWGHPKHDKLSLFIGDILLTISTVMLVSSLFRSEARSGLWGACASCIIVLTFLANFYAFDLYDLTALNGLRTVFHLTVACGVAVLFLSVWFSLLPRFGYHRNTMMAATPVLVGTLYVWRRVFAHVTQIFASREPLLVIGRASDAESLRAVVEATNSRYELVGFLSQAQAVSALPKNGDETHEELAENVASGASWQGARASAGAAAAVALAVAKPGLGRSRVVEGSRVAPLGVATAERLLEITLTRNIRSLVVRSECIDPELASVLTRLRFEGMRVHPLPDFYMRLAGELPMEVLTETWLSFASGFDVLHARLSRRTKRLMDLLLASIGLLVALPFLLIAAMMIKLDSQGPVLFVQWRVGWMGRPFRLLKLRSMRHDAESDGKAQWASVGDPRSTRVGRILRRLRLDELPQIVNILRGEMSFVGPRPERPEFVEELTTSIPFYHLRHYVLPGITGWAQVKYPYGASVEDARRKLQFDLYYIRNASPWLDLRIVLRTLRVVLFRVGSR
jgi:lipopolysaccharide/colanic/teichoic acid biosynthesis glycosyltransferase